MEPNQALAKIHELMQRGNLQQALVECESALIKQPENSELLHLAAICCAHVSDLDKALEYIIKAEQLNQTNPQLYNSYGNILLRCNKLDEALNAFSIAVTLKPNYSAAYNNLGNTYFHKENYSQAKASYQKALEFDVKFAEAFFNLARVEIMELNYDKAESYLKRVIMLAPKHFRALSQLGQLYLQLHRFDEASVRLEESIAINAQQPSALAALGAIYLKKLRFDDAIDALEQALALDPKFQHANWHLATAYLATNQTQKALQFYMRELELDPNVDCFYNIGVLLSDQNRFADAEEYLKAALERDPDYLPAQLNLAAIYLKQQKTDNAITHYQNALNLKPGDPEIEYVLHALKQDANPERAPETFVKQLFDQYATHYDQHLKNHLRFQVPQLIKAVLDEKLQNRHELRALDLGCGTGLTGELIAPLCNELIGVDVSPKMLEQAKHKNIYQLLENCDALTALNKFKNLDLIVAGDVFTYIGELAEIFKLSDAALKKGGLFAFTVEQSEQPGFHLTQQIRYQHSRDYLEKLIKVNNFKTLAFIEAPLREQFKQPVNGYVILLEKS